MTKFSHENRTLAVGTRVTPDQKQLLRCLAVAQQITESELLRRALDAYVCHEPKPDSRNQAPG